MSIDQLLIEIGLSEKEARMYVTLLRLGAQPTSVLAQKAKMNRGTAYVILHSLLEKTLATKMTKDGVHYFSPLDPKHLLSFIDNKKRTMESNRQKVETMMANLSAIQNPSVTKPKMQFFDGVDGARAVLESTLSAQDKTLRAYLSLANVIKFVGADAFEDYTEKRIAAGYALHEIRTREKDKEAFGLDPRSMRHTTSRRELREIRHASEDLAFPMTMFIYDDKIAIISSGEENFAMVMESKELADMQHKLFEILWRSLERKTIRVGVIHSLTGTMAISERPLADAVLMAIDEINANGGLLGRKIEPTVVDGASDPEKFAQAAEQLIAEEGVTSVFGGWTSASRKTMKPVFEKNNHLLWYPLQYEGLEQSPNIIYTGAAPNQQAIPAVDYACEHLGKTFFLVGSDYVFPRSANEIMKARIAELKGKVVGEEYEILGGDDFADIVRKIQKEKPQVILNTINGDSNVAFFRQLRKAGISSKDVHTMSLSITEEEINKMDITLVLGDYAAWNYFQSINTDANRKFVGNFKEKYGARRVTGDPIESAYVSMYLFAAAVEKAGSIDIAEVRKAAKGLIFRAPEGLIRIDPDNQHLHKIARIGQIGADGQFTVVWESKNPLKPEPYPKYKSREQWHAFLKVMQKRWKGHWEKR
ncbi:MAG: urea ABC transporter substrate-binding protein [Candidatus Peribacteraceae bacterium]|nr:urea ABC transporter substrate-binding protein [Candidatus Peribacteraceae bacterium]